jgi:hypothetical protein
VKGSVTELKKIREHAAWNRTGLARGERWRFEFARAFGFAPLTGVFRCAGPAAWTDGGCQFRHERLQVQRPVRASVTARFSEYTNILKESLTCAFFVRGLLFILRRYTKDKAKWPKICLWSVTMQPLPQRKARAPPARAAVIGLRLAKSVITP